MKCSEKLRTLQEDTSSKRGPDHLDLRLLQEVRDNQDQVQESSDRRRELLRHPPPLHCQRHCSSVLLFVRTWLGSCDFCPHVVANVARTKVQRSHVLAVKPGRFSIHFQYLPTLICHAMRINRGMSQVLHICVIHRAVAQLL